MDCRVPGIGRHHGHSSTLALYVNSHHHTSCMDLPCSWNRSSPKPQLDAKQSVENLLPNKDGDTTGLQVNLMIGMTPSRVFVQVGLFLARKFQPMSPVQVLTKFSELKSH
ncbi:hypothetical protein MTO96_040805 [Rhipicephalus appendiculatus]